MGYEQIKKIIAGIVENEFNHVQEFKEFEFEDTDKEQKILNAASSVLRDKLMNRLSEEDKCLLIKLEDVIVEEWTNLLRFYFKEGVAAGLTNLKFLNEIDHIETYI